MFKNVVIGSTLAIILSGCATTPESDRAFRKLMVGYDGLSCEEGRQQRLTEGATQEIAQANYEACMKARY